MKSISTLYGLVAIVFSFFSYPPTCDQSLPVDMRLDNVNEQNIVLDGHDVTAFFTDNQVVKGNPNYASQMDGITYHFASEKAKQMFDENPTKYIPQFGGFCAVAASFNKVEPVQLDLFDVYEDKLYFSRNEKAQKIWNKKKKKTKKRADKLWPCLVIDNGRKI